MSEEQTKAALAAFQKQHGKILEVLGKDYWAIRVQSPPSWSDAECMAVFFSDAANQARIIRMLRRPLVRELFEARDISFSRAAQLLGMQPEELRLAAKDEKWKARCPQEAHWWATGEGDASMPWDEPKRISSGGADRGHITRRP